MYKSLIFLIITLLFFQGCSTSRLKVITAPAFHIQELKSFQIEPIEVNATHGLNNQVTSKANILETRLRDNLISKGYIATLDSKPSFLVSLHISAMSETILAPGDLNFMKGVRGSTFPVADPRARTYDSDALVFEVKLQPNSSPQITAACLIPSEDSLSRPNYEIPFSEVESCLYSLLDNIPARQ